MQRDFAKGVFKEGDSVESLLKAHKPTEILNHSPYQTLFYANPPSIRDWDMIVARDGKLVMGQVGTRNFIRFGEHLKDPDYLTSLGEVLRRLAEEHCQGQAAMVGYPTVVGFSEEALLRVIISQRSGSSR